MNDVTTHLKQHNRTNLAPFACFASQSRGRLYKEAESATRSPFQRDRDRIVHSTAFRRLKHKTQVFVYHEGDHFRTRLTHSIEVAQIARSLARAFSVDEDLTEALALSHDFGHTPFGHTGEDALNEMMKAFGGFDHNVQSFRIVTYLEQRYAQFDGLNLSWETLEGLIKHNGPMIDGDQDLTGLDSVIRDFDAKMNLELAKYSSVEAQCAAIADDVAYNAHDLDDGLRAGLFDLEDLADMPLISGMLSVIDRDFPGIEKSRVIHELVRRLITFMVEDVISTSSRRLRELKPESARDVRDAGRTIVGFSKETEKAVAIIKQFLFANMYRAPGVVEIRRKADRILKDLFQVYWDGREDMPDGWGTEYRLSTRKQDQNRTARTVCDYIAGMTDRYALLEHQRIFDETPDLV